MKRSPAEERPEPFRSEGAREQSDDHGYVEHVVTRVLRRGKLDERSHEHDLYPSAIHPEPEKEQRYVGQPIDQPAPGECGPVFCNILPLGSLLCHDPIPSINASAVLSSLPLYRKALREPTVRRVQIS